MEKTVRHFGMCEQTVCRYFHTVTCFTYYSLTVICYNTVSEKKSTVFRE